jgi:hypothetical protein
MNIIGGESAFVLRSPTSSSFYQCLGTTDLRPFQGRDDPATVMKMMKNLTELRRCIRNDLGDPRRPNRSAYKVIRTPTRLPGGKNTMVFVDPDWSPRSARMRNKEPRQVGA